MLEKLLKKLNDQRTDLEKDEMNTKHALDMLMQDIKAQIEQRDKGKKLQAKVDAEGEREDATITCDADF